MIYMLRLVVALAVALFLSIAGNVYLYKNMSNTDKESVENTCQDARKADDAAMQSLEDSRENIQKNAQEKRDALKDIGSMDSIDDLLERCRRGMFGKGANKDCGFDAAKSGNGTMFDSKNP